MIADGAMIGFAPCFCCKRVFPFDVDRVPSHAGQPICRSCFERVNAQKRARGLPEFRALPGAYPLDEPVDD
jgi:hypothetical protein